MDKLVRNDLSILPERAERNRDEGKKFGRGTRSQVGVKRVIYKAHHRKWVLLCAAAKSRANSAIVVNEACPPKIASPEHRTVAWDKANWQRTVCTKSAFLGSLCSNTLLCSAQTHCWIESTAASRDQATSRPAQPPETKTTWNDKTVSCDIKEPHLQVRYFRDLLWHGMLLQTTL